MKKNIKNKFYIISFNYKHLPLEERENFIKNGYKNILSEYKNNEKIKGYISVETCLRIELYLESDKNFDLEQLKTDFKIRKMQIYEEEDAIKYLLKVICGLDSIIKGEDQILAQLKKAYLKHMAEGKTSTLLNIIFNQAVETGKKFRNESKINEKNVSLDSIAVKFIKNKIESIKNKKIFVIGVGDLSQSILALLYKNKDCILTMTNRSVQRSMEVQKLFDGVKTVEFKEKYEIAVESDIIISATAAPHLVLKKEKFGDSLNDGKKRLFLDLAVPRDIDVKLKEYDNIQLYHLEDIWDEYNKNVEKRDEIVEQYFYIIEEQFEKINEKIEKRKIYVND